MNDLSAGWRYTTHLCANWSDLGYNTLQASAYGDYATKEQAWDSDLH